jgi:hypothetical protein
VKTFPLDPGAAPWPCWLDQGWPRFLRRYTRTKDGTPHTYDALVESVRTDAGPRQRVVAYVGELNHDQGRRWQRTVVFHNRQGEAQQLRLSPDDDNVPLSDDPDVVRIRLGGVGWTNGRRFGDVWLARWLWHYLHLDASVARHLPQGRHTVAPADIVAIEVLKRPCAACREFALAEQWYASTALPDLLGVPDDAVTKDRLYRTLDALLRAKEPIENDPKAQLGTLFQLTYDLLLYDLTSTYFEGLPEDNDLARRGYWRDHRSDGRQVVLARVVTGAGFPSAHATLAGNTQDVETVKRIVGAVERRFGQSQRVWVMDRGRISKATLHSLGRGQRRYLLATRRGELARSPAELGRAGWQRLPDNPEVGVQQLRRGRVHYLLARSKPRRQKERAMRRRQRRGLAQALRKLHAPVAAGRLKQRDKILERIGRLKARYAKACPLVTITVAARGSAPLSWSCKVEKFKAALAADGAYLLRSNQGGWSAQVFWGVSGQVQCGSGRRPAAESCHSGRRDGRERRRCRSGEDNHRRLFAAGFRCRRETQVAGEAALPLGGIPPLPDLVLRASCPGGVHRRFLVAGGPACRGSAAAASLHTLLRRRSPLVTEGSQGSA